MTLCSLGRDCDATMSIGKTIKIRRGTSFKVYQKSTKVKMGKKKMLDVVIVNDCEVDQTEQSSTNEQQKLLDGDITISNITN